MEDKLLKFMLIAMAVTMFVWLVVASVVVINQLTRLI